LVCITTVHTMLLRNSQCQPCNSRAYSAIPVPTVQTWHGRHGNATAFYLCPRGDIGLLIRFLALRRENAFVDDDLATGGGDRHRASFTNDVNIRTHDFFSGFAYMVG